MEETISFLREEPILSHFSVYNVSVYDLSVFIFCLSLMPIIIRTALQRLFPDLRFLRKRAASNRKFSSLEMDVIPLVDQEGDRA